MSVFGTKGVRNSREREEGRQWTVTLMLFKLQSRAVLVWPPQTEIGERVKLDVHCFSPDCLSPHTLAHMTED